MIEISIEKCNSELNQSFKLHQSLTVTTEFVECAPQEDIDEFFENQVTQVCMWVMERYFDAVNIDVPLPHRWQSYIEQGKSNRAIVDLSSNFYDLIDSYFNSFWNLRNIPEKTGSFLTTNSFFPTLVEDPNIQMQITFQVTS